MIVEENRRDEWNDFVACCPHGTVLQCWEWGELKQHTGWQPLPVAATEGGQIVAACLMLKRRLPLIGGCLLYAPRGPVLDFANRTAWTNLLCEIRDIAKAHRAMALKVDPAISVECSEVASILSASGFRRVSGEGDFGGVQPRYVMKVDISGDLQEVMADFKSKTRYNIRLAEHRGVTIRSGEREDISDFYQILETTAQRDGFAIRDISYYYDIWDLIISRDLGKMFLAYVEDQLVAGTIAFTLSQQAWYVYGASSDRHRNLMPNYLLQWRMMQWAKQRGCTVYDMRGVAREVEGEAQGELAGLNRFKRGFAAQYVEYIGEWDLVFRPGLYRLFNIVQPLVKRIRRSASGLLDQSG